MATSTGIIELEGTLGGISFYQRKGKRIARKTGGPSREQVLTGKRFERTRENATEFGGAAIASAALRMSMMPFSRTFSSWNISSRLTAKFRKIAGAGEGIRGRRSIAALRHKEHLIGFDFNEDLPLAQIFRAKTMFTCREDRKASSIVLERFQSGRDVYAIQGATHIRLFYSIAVQPVFSYQASSEKYVAENGLSGHIAANSHTAVIPLDNTVQDISLTATLGNENAVSKDDALVCAIGIEFYQQTGFEFYPLKSGKSMRIVEVF